ncbi:unnamed protein product [Trichobilharzia regenti]|nr:unnamed protein product [Trichobilharzia regenti]
MLSNVRFEDTMNACDMFKNDPLVHTPGVQFTYSTFAFTLLSAVIEKVCLLKGDLFERSSPTVKMELNTSDNDNKGNKGKKSNNLPKWARFDTHLSRLFQYLSLSNTSLEYPEEITSSRAGQYRRSEKGVLTNTPTIDNSYKWAGGGILSTAIDLVRFADHLAFIYMGWLDSYGIVKRSTLSQLWEVSCVPPDQKTLPGLGWFLARRSGDPATVKTDYPDRLFALHTGGAVGGTTVLLISVPLLKDEVKHLNSTKINSSIENDNAKNIDRKYPTDIRLKSADIPPISVAILTNLENVSGISGLAIQLSELFLDYALQELVD